MLEIIWIYFIAILLVGFLEKCVNKKYWRIQIPFTLSLKKLKGQIKIGTEMYWRFFIRLWRLPLIYGSYYLWRLESSHFGLLCPTLNKAYFLKKVEKFLCESCFQKKYSNKCFCSVPLHLLSLGSYPIFFLGELKRYLKKWKLLWTKISICWNMLLQNHGVWKKLWISKKKHAYI